MDENEEGSAPALPVLTFQTFLFFLVAAILGQLSWELFRKVFILVRDDV